MNVNILFQNALHSFKKGQLEKAKRNLYKIIDSYPHYSDALNMLGVVYVKENKVDKSCKYFEKAISFNPDVLSYYINYGNALIMLDNHYEAVNIFRKLIQLNPKEYSNWIKLGDSLYEIKQFVDAENCYRTVLSSFSDQSIPYEVIVKFADILISSCKFEEAVYWYQKAIIVNQDDYTIYNKLGIALFNYGSKNDALSMFKRAIILKNDYQDAINNFWWCDPVWDEEILSRRVMLKKYDVHSVEFLNKCFENKDFIKRYYRFMHRQRKSQMINDIEKYQNEPLSSICSINWIIYYCNDNEYNPVGIINLTDISMLDRRAELLMGVLPLEKRRSAAIPGRS